MKPKIGITMGDPAGIGPEVVLKSLSDPGLSSLYQPILIGVPQVFEKVSEDLKLAIELSLLNNVASELPIRVSRGPKVDSTLLSSQGRLDSLLVPRRLDSRDSIREGRFDRRRRGRIPIIPCGELKGPAGRKPSAEGGESSFLAIKLATELALDGKIDAVVTAPISKYSLHLADHAYPGHTELLSYLTKTERYAMMLLSGDYRVVLMTSATCLRAR